MLRRLCVVAVLVCLSVFLPGTSVAQYVHCAACVEIDGPQNGGTICVEVTWNVEGSSLCSSHPTCLIPGPPGEPCQYYWWDCGDGGNTDCAVYYAGTDGGLTPNGSPLWAWAPETARSA